MRRLAPVARISASACGRIRFSAAGSSGGAMSAARPSHWSLLKTVKRFQERNSFRFVAGLRGALCKPKLARHSAKRKASARRRGDSLLTRATDYDWRMPRVKLSRIFGSGASIGPGKATLLEGIRNSGSISARHAAAIARETAFGI
jgi:hypothetical protein